MAENDTRLNYPLPAPADDEGSPILATVAQFAIPLTVYVSAIIFFQGHNKPGGGFIAGVLAAAAGAMGLLSFGTTAKAGFATWKVFAIALLIFPVAGGIAAALTLVVGMAYRLSLGRRTIETYTWWKLSIVGMAISIATGLMPFFQGNGFMNHQTFHVHLPWGNEHLPTATFFDVGVYMIVFGTLMTIFVELGLEDCPEELENSESVDASQVEPSQVPRSREESA